MKKETIEEASENYCKSKFGATTGNKSVVDGIIFGAKWQKEQMLKDMQEYAEFCIECDRKEMPLLLVSDWYEHYKID